MTIERLLEAGRALESGRLDQAERIYRQVAGADPRSSIAIVGLARVARRRGNEPETLRLAAAALAVDPGNVAAQRLLGDAGGDSGTGAGAAGAATSSTAADAVGREPAAAVDDDWPWPDLEEQLARYRDAEPRRLSRLLNRG